MEDQDFQLALDHLLRKRNPRLFTGELTLREVERFRQELIPAVAADVRGGLYEWSDACRVEAFIEGKQRTLFQTTVLDAVVDRTLGRWLAHCAEPHHSTHLYSYRPGRGPASAWQGFRDYLAQHRARTPEVRSRGVFVLRRDVRAYGETIPVDEASVLWGLVDRVTAGEAHRECVQALLRTLLRRRWYNAKGETGILAVGTPTGSSVQPVINNLYLGSLDTLGASLGFYARFGDDVLFATDDPARCQDVSLRMEREVTRLRLEFGASKSRNLYFNGAARPTAEGEWEPVDAVEYLGAAVRFNGTVVLNREKWSYLLGRLDRRLRRAREQAGPMAADGLCELLCRVAREALDEAHALFGGEAHFFLQHVDDRSQLRSFDYWLCKRVAELSSGCSGVRAFRVFPPSYLFSSGLPSVVARRNSR